jgi:hypothetical protein
MGRPISRQAEKRVHRLSSGGRPIRPDNDLDSVVCLGRSPGYDQGRNTRMMQQRCADTPPR